MVFPRAFAFAIDDMGWIDGSSFTAQSGPSRAGVKRIFDLNDYRYIVQVAEAVNVRIQGLFILSEMDRENVLAKYPTTTYRRERWDNSKNIDARQLEIMNYVKEQAAYLEFGLHGTGHEHWPEPGRQRRAEWYNLEDDHPWPEESLRQHVQGFKDIMRQYGLSEEFGHSFPQSFVPCAYSYYWNPDGHYSLGKILSEAGVKYANTDFSHIPELRPPPEPNGGGFDNGTLVVNRKNFGNPWYALACLPKTPIAGQDTDMIESHWPNWLAADDFLQSEVTKQWIQYYNSVQRLPDRYVAKNTEQFYAQWLYQKFTKVTEETGGYVAIDNTSMPEEVYQRDVLGNLVLKIALLKNEHISFATLDDKAIAAYYEDGGYGFLYLPQLEKKKYTLKYTIGQSPMPLYVFHDGTYNVYSMIRSDSDVSVDVRVYGRQIIKIRTAQPGRLVSRNPRLKVVKSFYESDVSTLNITVQSTDMQGDRGVIVMLL